MKKRRNAIVALVLLMAVLFQSGCEFKDIDKRFFITALGVDKPKDTSKKYRVTLKIAIPKGQLQMGQEDFITVSQDSDSISDAIQKLKTTSDKEFDFGHTKVLVLGESLAKENYVDALDFFARQRFIQRIAWMVIAKPDAESLLLARQKSERLPANALILAFGGQGVESQYIVSQYLFQFYRKYKDPGEYPVLPYAEPGTSKEGSFYRIDNIAVLDDSKLVMTLSPDETKFCNVLNGVVQKSDYMVTAGDNTYTVHANRIDVAKKINDGKNPAINLNVNIEGIVEEEMERRKITENLLKQIEQGTEKQFSEGATAILTKLQKQNLDPIGFGALYRSRHWQDVDTELKEWKALYPKAKIHVNVHCVLRAPGAIM